MSYKKTLEGVRYLVQNELDMASENNGEWFNSAHEAYAVILEEENELYDEYLEVERHLDKYWDSVTKDAADTKELEEIEKRATRCACEAIQVAAMARKAMRWQD